MAEGKRYAFALNRERPDFIGEFVSVENGFLTLANPMVVEYKTDFTASFSADFLPSAMPPRYDRMLTVSIPVSSLYYFVMLAEDDIMTVGYLTELSMTPDKAVPD